MTVRTFSRMDLSDAVVRDVGLSRNESSKLIDLILELMSRALESGENVKISSFGAFNLSDKKERIGRNPKTGQTATITPRRVIGFRTSNFLRTRVKKGNQGN